MNKLLLSDEEVNVLLDLISGYDVSDYGPQLEKLENKLRDL